MFKKLCILLIFQIKGDQTFNRQLSYAQLYAIFAKLLNICKQIADNTMTDRRKTTSSLCNTIRERMVSEMDGGEDYFCIDSKPIEVCRIACIQM